MNEFLFLKELLIEHWIYDSFRKKNYPVCLLQNKKMGVLYTIGIQIINI